jgi:archaellum biogenesis protein FlaJ (TadC family)
MLNGINPKLLGLDAVTLIGLVLSIGIAGLIGNWFLMLSAIMLVVGAIRSIHMGRGPIAAVAVALVWLYVLSTIAW